MTKKPILGYHDPCPDGHGAAFAFWLKYGDSIEYLPISHKAEPFKGIPLETFADRRVWLVDIAFEREDLLKVKEVADELVVLDHHISNKEHLEDLDFCFFDMYHSGAVLAWNYCFPERPVLKLLQYVEDRDLYTWKLPYAQELLTAVDAHERTFESWEHLSQKIEEPTGFAKLLGQGEAILKYNKVLMKIIKQGVYYTEIKGYKVPIINTPFFRGEIGTELAQEAPFSAIYHFDGENFVFSLRSTDEGVDVKEIALMFPGGGGHRNASGFSVKSLDDLK